MSKDIFYVEYILGSGTDSSSFKLTQLVAHEDRKSNIYSHSYYAKDCKDAGQRIANMVSTLTKDIEIYVDTAGFGICLFDELVGLLESSGFKYNRINGSLVKKKNKFEGVKAPVQVSTKKPPQVTFNGTVNFSDIALNLDAETLNKLIGESIKNNLTKGVF